VSRATIYRHRHRSEEAVCKRPGPQGMMAAGRTHEISRLNPGALTG
jgi:hypothetical protein